MSASTLWKQLRYLLFTILSLIVRSNSSISCFRHQLIYVLVLLNFVIKLNVNHKDLKDQTVLYRSMETKRRSSLTWVFKVSALQTVDRGLKKYNKIHVCSCFETRNEQLTRCLHYTGNTMVQLTANNFSMEIHICYLFTFSGEQQSTSSTRRSAQSNVRT